MLAEPKDDPFRKGALAISGPDTKGHITITGPMEDISPAVLELANNMQTAKVGEPWYCKCELDGREYEIHPELPKDAMVAASYKCYRQTGSRTYTNLRPGPVNL